MQSLKQLCIALPLLAVCAACPGEPNVDQEGCEHLKEGPATAVTALASGEGPLVADDHHRYDVSLVAITGGNGGRVRFASDEQGDFIIFLNQGVPLKVLDSSGAEVAIEASATSSTACTDIRGRHVVPLGVGTYTLSLGPTTQTSVGIVIEHAAHEH
jgi:hypothetical protein